MANYCRFCGAPTPGPFCGQCGKAISEGAPSHPASLPSCQTSASAPQAHPLSMTSSPGPKILFVALGVIGFLGVAAAGTVWYGWHRVKQTVASKGIDLVSVADSGAGRRLDACLLLTKEDLGQILNLTIDRSEGTGPSAHSTCRYYSSAAQKRGTDEAAAAIKKMQEAANANDSPAQQENAVNELENLVRGIGGAAAGATNGEVLTIELDSETAKAAMVGFRLGSGVSAAVVTGDAKPAARKFFSEDVKGIGDEAAFGPIASLLMFRKGDVNVKLDARTLPDRRDAEIAIAKCILAKL